MKSMDRTAVLLLIIAVAFAGCTSLGGGNQTREQEKDPKQITVSGPDCQISGTACSARAFTKYEGPGRVTITFNNDGGAPVTVDIGKLGSKVMVAKCNDQLVNVTDFRMVRSGDSARFATRGRRVFHDAPSDGTVDVLSGESLRLIWKLELVPSGSVSELGYACPMEFELRFEQELNSTRQVQVKPSESTPNVQDLLFDTSSKSPVRLQIDAPSHVVAPATGSKKIVVEGYLVNKGQGTVTNITELTSAELTCRNPDLDIRMYGQGPRAGQSYRRICTDTVSSVSSSEIRSLTFSATYRYRLPLGGFTIKLDKVG